MTDGGAGTALVTGASSGIGRELARLLARDGHTLILTARDEERLRAVAAELRERHGTGSTVIAVDLSQPDGAAKLVEQIERAGLTVDVLVNNAGAGAAGPFAEVPLERQLAVIQLNLVALTELTRRLLPGMLARRRGRVLNVSSTAAFQPGPYMAVYYATKAYVLSLSEAIAAEVAGSGVTVTTLCPGPTRTEFFERASMRKSPLARSSILDAAAVAEAGYAGMLRGRTLVVPGLTNRVARHLARLAPRRLVTGIVARLNAGRRR
ncbi:MAG TPA: SDR family oxidoreductase [Gemmatimonadales bacterium]|nr:SDR family oxidoreductase [Gemmatimonadales bacterium]